MLLPGTESEAKERAKERKTDAAGGTRRLDRGRDVLRQRPLASLLLLCVVLLVILWSSIGFGLHAERDRATETAMRETANRARFFEDLVVRTLSQADETLRYLAGQYLRSGSGYDLEEFARVRLAHLEPWHGITIADERGDVVLSFPGRPRRINLRERDSFKVHLAPDAPQPAIGIPHVGIVSGKWTVPVTRRITRPDGGFAGVASIGLDPGFFSAFYDRLDLGADSTAMLVGRDGIVRVRRAKEEVTAGQDVTGYEIFRHMQSAESGDYVTKSALDGIPRIVSYRVLKDYPLVVTVGMSQAVALQAYSRLAGQLVAWAGLITLATLAFVAVAVAQARRQDATADALRASEARYRTFIGATSRIVWTTDASGDLVHDAPSWREYTGQTFEEIRGAGWLQAVMPEDRSRVIAQWTEALRSCSVYAVEYRLRGDDGVYRPFECRAVPVFGADGEVREWIGVVEDITATKQAERTRDLLATIVEHASDAIISRDMNGVIMSWNQAAERMFGYTAEEAIGRNVSLIRADDPAEFERRNVRIRSGGVIPPTEGLRRTKDGRVLNVLSTVFPIRNDDGAVVGAAAILRDVTESRRSAEMRARLAAIVENANDAIISRSLDGTITSWNAAAQRLFGYTAAEAVGRHISLILRDGAAHHVEDNSVRLQRGESLPPRQGVRRTKDGRLIPIMNSISSITGDAGEVIGVAVTIRDITAELKAEEALRLAAGVYESAAEGILITDAKNNVVSVNRAYSDITGYASEETVGRNPRILASGQHSTAFYDELWTSLREQGRWQGEVWDRRKNQERYCALLSVSVIRDPQGEITQHCWLLMDITARKRYEEELLTLNAELENRVAERTLKLEGANKELSAFSYSVSHDLRAPIRAIQGFSTLLMAKDASALTPEAFARLKRIQDNAEWMGQLIDDLLRLSRVSQRQLERRQFDLTALSDEVVHRLRRAEPERRVDVSVQAGMMTDGDASLMRHVMENLIGNAWKFTSRTLQPRIEVGAENSNGRDVYYVKDNGAGFDMQYAHKLFSAFQRLHHRDEFEGTGIGLSIVQRVVVKHGGTVWAAAEVGRGATFYFTLR